MSKGILGTRAALFYLGYWISIAWFGITGPLFFGLLPHKIRSRYILLWNRFVIFWLHCTCGLKVNVIGLDNLPPPPYVALSKHQSNWETYFLQFYLEPVAIVLKRELLKIPFFGWGLRLTDPIAIDRGSPKQALKQTQEDGKKRIANGISVLIFPEGTRIAPGEKSKYARGGANIAVAANVPTIPIAHNAGEYWPSHKIIKYPGTITLTIGKPIAPDQSSRDITEQAQHWIEAEVAAMGNRTTD